MSCQETVRLFSLRAQMLQTLAMHGLRIESNVIKCNYFVLYHIMLL